MPTGTDKRKLNRRDLIFGVGSTLSFFVLGGSPLIAKAQAAEASPTKKKIAPNYFNEDILHRNEHPFGISNRLKGQLQDICAEAPLHHYKFLNDQTDDLKKALSKKLNLSPDLLFLAPGAGPTLEKILNTIRWENSSLAISDPDFYFLTRVAEYLKIKHYKVPTNAKNEVDLEALAKTGAGYIYFSNPHVPYGKAKSRSDIEALLKSVKSNCIVVVDEAYSEFSDRYNEITALDLVKKYKNLVVVRTFSKIYGLASLRIGYYATQNKKFSEYFTIYTVSALAAKAAVLALEDKEHFAETFKYVKQAKEKIVNAAAARGIPTISSEANFVTLLTKTDQRRQIVEALNKLRYSFSAAGKSAYLRLSLVSPQALEDAIQAITLVK